MNGILAFGQSVVSAIEPWKGVIASVGGFLAAALGVLGGIIKQRRVADVTASDHATYTPRATTIRLHADDREAITDFRSTLGDLREAVEDLTRVTRQNTRAVDENTGGRA